MIANTILQSVTHFFLKASIGLLTFSCQLLKNCNFVMSNYDLFSTLSYFLVLWGLNFFKTLAFCLTQPFYTKLLCKQQDGGLQMSISRISLFVYGIFILLGEGGGIELSCAAKGPL